MKKLAKKLMSLPEKMFFFLFVQKKSLNLKNLFQRGEKKDNFFTIKLSSFSSAEVSLVVNGRKRININ